MDSTEVKTVILTFLLWSFAGFDLILLTLSSVEIQKFYFPNTDQTVSILAVYGTLSLSLLGRVFGGVYFSRLADTHGRKPVVTLCLMVLSITTLFSAFLPNIYTNLTPLPSTVIPILFIVTRIIIGFFIGGIWPTAAILGLEIISTNRLKLVFNNDFKEETIFDKRWSNYLQNYRLLREYENYFKRKTRKLTGKSASMQIGFFTGYFIAASLYYNHIALPYYNNIGSFGSMSLMAGLIGFVLFIFYRVFIPESNYWKFSKYLYEEQKYFLQEQKENEENNKLMKSVTKFKQDSLEPGISNLLNNKEYREKLIGFWLIMSGLMYMYYSTVVVIPEILTRDNISIGLPFFPNIPIKFGVLIILSTALIAHAILGLFLYKAWKEKSFRKNKLIYPFYRIFEKSSKRINNKILEIFDGYNNTLTKEKENQVKYDKNESNLDFIVIEIIGYMIIAIGILNSIIFYTLIYNRENGFIIIIFTAIATLVANSGWALMPSMLASRFPTHFRITGSSIAYNGGLAISFASPFIIMEFYFSIRSEYVIFITMILGAVSMIIGAKRLIHHNQDNL